jgi:hypothetical protein
MYFILALVLAAAPVDCKECNQASNKVRVSGAAVSSSPAPRIIRERIRIKGRFKKGGCCG